MEFTKYNHLIQEKKIYDFWEKNDLFKPRKKKLKKTFSIVIPLPTIIIFDFSCIFKILILELYQYHFCLCFLLLNFFQQLLELQFQRDQYLAAIKFRIHSYDGI